jgi:hypothetical protein
MDLYDLSSLLLPIFRIVELKVPNLFPDYLAKGPITWLLDFPILLKQAFPQLEDFDLSDPLHSGWLQLMVKKCIGKLWQQRYPLSYCWDGRCDNLLWNPYQPLCKERSSTVIFAPNTFQAGLVPLLLEHCDFLNRSVHCDHYKSSLREIIELNNESCVDSTVSDAEYLLNLALQNWAFADSPLRVAAMKKAGSYLNRPIEFSVEFFYEEEKRVYDFAKSFEVLRDDLVELKKLNDQAQERREIFENRKGKCKELEDRIVEESNEAAKKYHFSISRDEFIDIFRHVREGRNLFDLQVVKWYFMTTNSLMLYARRWSEREAVSMELEDIKGRIKEREIHANQRAEECFRLRWLSLGEC